MAAERAAKMNKPGVMYKLLGEDGQEYGPVPAEQVKKWIWEKRLEKTSPTLPQGAADWIFLGSLPEFAADFGPVPGTDAPSYSRNRVAQKAFYLGIFAVIPILGALLGWIALVLGMRGLVFYWKTPGAGGKLQAWVGIVVGGACGLAYSTLIVLAWMAHKHGTH